jgi:hypothetical protein
MIPCGYREEIGEDKIVLCHHPEVHAKDDVVVRGFCKGCQLATEDVPKPRLGDRVEATIKAVTFGLVKSCGGCKKRKSWLNRWGR